MASPPYAPIEEHIRGILQDVRLNPLERCAAIELYYHTDWNTRRLKCRGVIVAHIRRTIGRGETAAKKTRKRLEDLGFIQGDYFDASAWVRSEVTGPKTDPSENGPVRKQTRLKTDYPPSENRPPPVRKRTPILLLLLLLLFLSQIQVDQTRARARRNNFQTKLSEQS